MIRMMHRMMYLVMNRAMMYRFMMHRMMSVMMILRHREPGQEKE
jgi:hypothetical protein